ncbi:WhiB family transcriptional regulator [Streptosporangium saharense]|uniref:4Fe-4S Wbl-type domain-containing protein n=1 Tax=Streptosporangium saharense TaxID=1706840 RepID=A0A7W7QK29_9ACTN|nr:WhiB family transcriptional regulator [Streptosporangium saharense]MBB4915070.1 hypothetical protein [Streptosporangium saharense]
MIPSLFGPVPDFHADAACGGQGKLMDSKTDQDIVRAKALCARCVVLKDCRAWAHELNGFKDPDMVLGGLTREERRTGVLEGERRCNTCHEVKPLAEFGRRKTGRGGRQSMCLICQRENAKAAYQRRARQRQEAHQTGKEQRAS